MLVSPFAELLEAAITEAGLSKRELARRMGINSTWFSKVPKGDLRFDKEKLERLCEVLGITGDRRREFIEAGLLARCPPEIIQLVRRLRRENARLVHYFPEPERERLRVADEPDEQK